MGALEAENCLCFQDEVEKWSLSVTEGNSDDSELVSSLPKRDARGVHGSVGQDEIFLLKTS